MQRLFVYGTLAPGRVNHHVLEPVPGKWTAATLKGRLLQEGWGADLGSPGIVPDAQGEAVSGHLFSSDQLEQHWAMLDEFEGDGYTRVQVTVTLADGENLEAWVYALNRCG